MQMSLVPTVKPKGRLESRNVHAHKAATGDMAANSTNQNQPPALLQAETRIRGQCENFSAYSLMPGDSLIAGHLSAYGLERFRTLSEKSGKNG